MAKSISSNKEKIECVYLLLKNDNEPKGYVGSTKDFDTRMKCYRHNQRRMLIEEEIEKNGFDSFDKIIIPVKTNSKKELERWESFYIKLFGTYVGDNPDFGLNKVEEPHRGSSSEETTKLAISKSTKGKIHLGVKRPYLSERNKIVKPALGRTGEKHPMSKKLLYVPDNKIFNSIKDCGDYFGVSRQAIKSRIKYNPKIYKLV
jgi:group I intron endonuclease